MTPAIFELPSHRSRLPQQREPALKLPTTPAGFGFGCRSRHSGSHGSGRREGQSLRDASFLHISSTQQPRIQGNSTLPMQCCGFWVSDALLDTQNTRICCTSNLFASLPSLRKSKSPKTIIRRRKSSMPGSGWLPDSGQRQFNSFFWSCYWSYLLFSSPASRFLLVTTSRRFNLSTCTPPLRAAYTKSWTLFKLYYHSGVLQPFQLDTLCITVRHHPDEQGAEKRTRLVKWTVLQTIRWNTQSPGQPWHRRKYICILKFSIGRAWRISIQNPSGSGGLCTGISHFKQQRRRWCSTQRPASGSNISML